MEKMLDYKDYKLYRFQCDCLTPNDAMDLTVEAAGGNKFYTISMHFNGHSFFDRLKYAFQILRGDWCWREFIVRQHCDDAKIISEIFSDKPFDELP